VETLVKSTGEDKKLLAKDYSKEEITEDQTIEDKANLQVVENKGLGKVGNVIYLVDMGDETSFTTGPWLNKGPLWRKMP